MLSDSLSLGIPPAAVAPYALTFFGFGGCGRGDAGGGFGGVGRGVGGATTARAGATRLVNVFSRITRGC